MCHRQMQEVYPHGLKRYVRAMNMVLLLGYHGTLYLYVSYSSVHVGACNSYNLEAGVL